MAKKRQEIDAAMTANKGPKGSTKPARPAPGFSSGLGKKSSGGIMTPDKGRA